MKRSRFTALRSIFRRHLFKKKATETQLIKLNSLKHDSIKKVKHIISNRTSRIKYYYASTEHNFRLLFDKYIVKGYYFNRYLRYLIVIL